MVERPDGTWSLRTEDPAGRLTRRTSGGVTVEIDRAADPVYRDGAPYVRHTVVTTSGGRSLSLDGAVEVTRDETDPSPFSVLERVETVMVAGSTMERRFDATARTIQWTTPEGRTAVATMDDRGRLAQFALPGLHPVAYHYDARGRLLDVTQGSGEQVRTTRFVYDSGPASHAYPVAVVGADEAPTSLSFDPLGRVTAVVDPAGSAVDLVYDDAALTLTLTPAGSASHQLSYDARGLLGAYEPPPLSGTSATTFTYDRDGAASGLELGDGRTLQITPDEAGRPVRATVAAGSLAFGYDPLTGALEHLSMPGGPDVDLEFDGPLLLGQTWTGPVQGTVRYEYDSAFRLESIQVGSEPLVVYSTDNDGLVTTAGPLTVSRDPASGFVTALDAGVVATTERISAFGQLDERTSRFAGGDFGQRVTARDALGRVTDLIETSDGLETRIGYQYDEHDRLEVVRHDDVVVERYRYDEPGNRTSWTNAAGRFTATYDAQDRLQTAAGLTYEHNGHGQRSSRTDPTTGAERRYDYDELGNLLAVRLDDGTAITYAVDAFGRRVQKQVDGTVERAWLYQDPLNPVAELDADGHVVALFVYATRGHVPELMLAEGRTYRLVADRLGSVRRVVDTETGEVVQALDYDAFGRVLRDTRPGFQPFGFAGGLYDPDTGLVRFGARDYDPDTGRWTAKDPIGFGGADTNLYAYVGNDPVQWIDPSGLIIDTVADIGFVGYDIYALFDDNILGDCDNLGGNLAALGLDVAATFIPFVTGAGLISRGVGKAAEGATRAEILAANRAAGLAAERLAARQLVAEGNTILGGQVSVRTSLGLRRTDHLIQTPGGQILAIEVKAGNAVRSSAQLAKDAALASEGGVLVGKNAPDILRGQHRIIQTIERVIR